MNPSDLFHEMNEGEYYPGWLRFIVLLCSSFIVQGTVYMDDTERWFKFTTDFVLSVLFYVPTSWMSDKRRRIATAMFSAHLTNYLLNGQLCAVLKKFDLILTSSAEFDDWLRLLSRQTQTHSSIAAAAAYGSLSRGTLQNTSDLDVRVIRYPGVLNGIRACIFIAELRLRALLDRFPLDIYVLDDFDSLAEMRDDESPIVLSDKVNHFSD